ncbi:winged helix-turn-helix domain-containing protein [Amycolatopsis sp. PS_44_ISF1]|uniref:winged helix-turn-helix domain-containing protein n=1 Tax=Amycolatopsis sp. PS_44_ISF1 TaxID=2974917 RepID=UPI0028E03C89|nr:winged helix-turn-helix domain-containing protein [Amycolatopsis sp. PS_44_ISF1]MDT8911092.1 helix-turn-helix domain-containing protein [Amycolatopsis sp. PS_44_ISF1]
MADLEIHAIRDSRVLAAMSHPLRRRLLDLLKLDGPATASALAEKTGQAVGNVSHHLKVLAGASLVEEAPELARDRRERWWRRPSSALSWSSADFVDDPVADAAETLNLDRQSSLARAWLASAETEPPLWRFSSFSNETWARLSAAELAELNERVIALFGEYAGRDQLDDGVERRPAFLYARGFPARP